MKFSNAKIEIALARACINARTLRENGVSPNTIKRAINEEDLKPATAGRIARALGVDVADLMESEH